MDHLFIEAEGELRVHAVSLLLTYNLAQTCRTTTLAAGPAVDNSPPPPAMRLAEVGPLLGCAGGNPQLDVVRS